MTINSNSRTIPKFNYWRVDKDSTLFANTFSDEIATGDIRVTGDAGKVNITTPTLELKNSAEISTATDSTGQGGTITVVADSLVLQEGSKLSTTTLARSQRVDNIEFKAGDAGSVELILKDRLKLTGQNTGIFANTAKDSSGKGGTIFIDPPIVELANGATIAVDSQGAGTGGDITLLADNLTLQQATITAETASTDGGNINLQIGNRLSLFDSSAITATAGTAQGAGDGGNIVINNENGNIIAYPTPINHEITANAFEGDGGNIDITTNGIFGEEFIDITASSEFGLDGTVIIRTPDTDPSKSLIRFPTNIVDAAQLIAQNLCEEGQDSEFIITGRGGLPPNPQQILETDLVRVNLMDTIAPSSQLDNKNSESSKLYNPKTGAEVIPARGWVFNDRGEVVLVNYDPTQITPQRLAARAHCQPFPREDFR